MIDSSNCGTRLTNLPGFKLSGNGKNETQSNHRDGGGRGSLAIHNCTKPTIAAINGHAVGVGITMTLPCMLRVAWSKAKIGFVFSQRGLVAEACSSYFLPRLIGHSRALQVAITGNILTADSKAYDGLFSELCDRQEDVLPAALKVAEGIASQTSPVSTWMIREMFYRGPNSAEEAHLLESRVMGAMRTGAVSSILLSYVAWLTPSLGQRRSRESVLGKANSHLQGHCSERHASRLPLVHAGQCQERPVV